MKRSITWLLAATASLGLSAGLIAPTYTADYNYEGNDDGGDRVAIDAFGNIYVAATCASDNDGLDMVVIKYSPTLSEIRSRKYDGPATGSNSDDVATGIAVDNAGNVFVSGTSMGSSGHKDVAIKGWKPNGDDLWTTSGFHNGAYRWSSSGSLDDNATDLAIDKNGNLYISGWYLNADYDAFVVGVTPAGALKSGWPKTVSVNGKNEFYLAVAVADDLSVFAGGYDSSISQTENFMAKIYAGGGSVLQEFNWDYQSANDRIVDVDCNDAHFVALGNVNYVNDGQNQGGRMALQSYTSEDSTIEWTTVTTVGTYSRGAEVMLRNGFAYATGFAFESSAFRVMTVKLSEGTGAYSSTWASSGGFGNGVRLYTAVEESQGNSIFASGDNVYIGGIESGESDLTDREYLTLGYDDTGALIVEDLYTNTFAAGDEIRDIVTGCGSVYVTGMYRVNETTEKFDATTLGYAAGVTSETPENIYTDEGTGTVTVAQIAVSNDHPNQPKGDVLASGASNPKATVRFEGTVGSNISELCFIAETSVDENGVQQRIEFYNFVSQSWVEFDKRSATVTDDQTVGVNIRVSPDAYVSNGLVKARIHFDDVGVTSDGFNGLFDFIQWRYR